DQFSAGTVYIDNLELAALLFGNAAGVVVAVAVWAHGERLRVASLQAHALAEIGVRDLARAFPATADACQLGDVAAVLLAAQSVHLGEHHCRTRPGTSTGSDHWTPCSAPQA